MEDFYSSVWGIPVAGASLPIIAFFFAKLPEIDGIVLGSPVYYAGASGQITSFLDRAFFAGSGESISGI